MDTCVALVNAYLRFNGYVAAPEHPVLVGQGRPYRYHTATDIDILAVRFPNAAVVVPRDSGIGRMSDDLHLEIDPLLDLRGGTVDVIVGEVKQSRPRLNPALRESEVLYATLRRIDPGFDTPLEETIDELIRNGVAESASGGRRWRFRLFAFGEGTPVLESGRFTSIQLSHAAMFLTSCIREHHQVWKDAQFGDPVLDLLHLFDKMGFSVIANPRVQQAAARNEPVTEAGLEERDPEVTQPVGTDSGKTRSQRKTRARQEQPVVVEEPEATAERPARKKAARKVQPKTGKRSVTQQAPKKQAAKQTSRKRANNLNPRVHRGGQRKS